jgi:predicted amidohydrolase YtcJ
MIADYAADNPDLPVITGAGWSPSIMGGFPTAADLDAAVSDRPALFIDVTSHEGWLNTAAMTDQKINKDNRYTDLGVPVTEPVG